MQLPNVAHPTKFNIDGYIFEIISFYPLTEQQAANAARVAYSTRKLRKKDKGKIIRAFLTADDESQGLL